MTAINLPEIFMKRLRRVGAYKRLFLDARGQLKADAKIVLDDLYEFTHFFDGAAVDPQMLAILEGGRKVVRRVIDRTKTSEAELRRYVTIGENDE